MTSTDIATVDAFADSITSFEDVLDEIEALARDHDLAWRLQLGHTFLRHFWRGDARAYQHGAPGKDLRFAAFFEKHGDALARYDIGPRKARDCIRASIVFDSLPPALAGRLFWTQVIELARLRDPTARAQVAVAALQSDWTVAQLRDAVDYAKQVGVPEPVALAQAVAAADAASAVVPEGSAAPAPGRMVARAEKLVEAVETWSATWRKVDGAALRPAQRARLVAARDALRARVAELDGLVGEVGAGD